MLGVWWHQGTEEMAFTRLHALGPEKFQNILNELVRGTPASMVARLIHEWGNAQNVREETLAKQLKRLQTAIAEGAFGPELAEQTHRPSVQISLRHVSTLNALDALGQLSAIQRQRVFDLYEKERTLNRPLASLNVVMRQYRDVLIAIQKIRFDLGLDAYRRGIPSAPGAPARVTVPDGTTMDPRVLEAIEETERIFDRYGIPRVIPPS